MEIFGETIERELPDLAKQGVRTRFIGRRDRAPDWLQAADGGAGGRDGRERPALALDRVRLRRPRRARRGGAQARSRPASAPTDVDEDALAAHLYAPELPDPDLLIRTSGELRLSNFLLWQLAYAELVFVETLWPDFGERRAARRARGLRARRRRRSAADEQLRLAHRSSRSSASRSCSALVCLGGWWLFALAAVRGAVALHELYVIARALRPLVLAGYAGSLATLARRRARRARVDGRRLHAHARARVPALRDRGDARSPRP